MGSMGALSSMLIKVVSNCSLTFGNSMVEIKSMPLHSGNYGDTMKFQHPWFQITNEAPVFCMSLHSFFLFLLIAWV